MSDDETPPGEPLGPLGWILIAEDLAVFAIALAGAGTDETTCRHAILRHMNQWHVSGPDILQAAAHAVQRFPQPLDATPEEVERAEPCRDLSGVLTVEQQLLDALAARELLQRLADEHQGR